jgi:hypothetical protein
LFSIETTTTTTACQHNRAQQTKHQRNGPTALAQIIDHDVYNMIEINFGRHKKRLLRAASLGGHNDCGLWANDARPLPVVVVVFRQVRSRRRPEIVAADATSRVV